MENKAKKQAETLSAEKEAAADVLQFSASEQYKSGLIRMVRFIFLENMAVSVLAFGLFGLMHFYQPEGGYFNIAADQRQTRMVALNQPNVTQAAMLSWVSGAVTEVLTFGFHDVQGKLGIAMRNFTPKGQQSFREAIKQTKLLETVEKNQQILTTAPRGPAIVTQEGELRDGNYFWRVQLPLIVTYQSGTKSRNDNVLVDVLIVRVPTQENPMGIGIEQWTNGPG